MKRRRFIQQLAAGAMAGLFCQGHPSSGSPGGSGVGGRVFSNGKPLAGVLVSNGRQVAQTDRDGRYTLPEEPDAGRFLFVTCPRGHWTDAFFRPIDAAARQGKADFTLRPMAQPDRFDFIFAADLSDLGNPAQEAGREKTKASFVEMNRLSPKPAFLLIQGDLGIREDGGGRFRECLKAAAMPVRLGIGNHEVDPSAANPKAIYEKNFGPTYYSFDWGPVHLVVLDGHKPADVKGNALGSVEPREFAWLEADLAAQPPGKPILVSVHIPIVSTYPARRPDLKEDQAPFWQSANGDRLTSLFARHGVRLVLQGHFHENERIVQGGVEYVESVSLCGRWWKSGRGFERATDDSPRGYRIVSIDGDKIRHRYQSSRESRVEVQGEFMKLRDTIAPKKETAFVFNCYDAPTGSTAQIRLNVGPWQAMTPVVLPDSRLDSPVVKPHHWRWTTDTTTLPPGRHVVEAEVVWPDGTVVRQAKRFQIAGKAS